MLNNITLPQLPIVLEEAITDLENEAAFEACQLKGLDFSGRTARAVSFDEVLLEKTILSAAVFDKLVGSDVILKACDLSAARCSELSLRRVLFSDCRATGWDCNKGSFKDVSFTGCKLDMINLRFTKLVNIRFVDCVLTDADFLGANLRNVTFERCLLERTSFVKAGLQTVDLRTSQLIDLNGWQYLKGAIIDSVQLMSAAPYLAGEIGIKVVD